MGDNSHSPFFVDVRDDNFIDEILSHYFVSFIEAGGNYSDFEDMTLAEVKMVVKGYENRINTQRKVNADMDYRLAMMIYANMGSLLDKKAKPPKFEDMYGDLFKDNQTNNDTPKDDTDEATLMAHLMQMEQFVNRHNKKFSKGSE